MVRVLGQTFCFQCGRSADYYSYADYQPAYGAVCINKSWIISATSIIAVRADLRL
jgi:hypothetical protein